VFSITTAQTHSSGKCCFPRIIPYFAGYAGLRVRSEGLRYSRCIDAGASCRVTIILRAASALPRQVSNFFEKNVFHMSKKEIEFEIIPQRLCG